MSVARAALLVLLAACHREVIVSRPLGAPASKVPPAPAGFATCDSVTLAPTGELAAFKLDGTRLGSVSLGPVAPMHGGWADREHLFVRTAPGKVVLVTRDGVTEVAVPALERDVPAPEGAAATAAETPAGQIDLVTGEGEAWWVRCPWSYANGECAAWISARLWPEPATRVQALVEPRDQRWYEENPAGYALAREADGLRCTPPAGPAATFAAARARWISAAPPRLLVTFGDGRYEIHDGCGAPIADGTGARPGADDTWTGVEAGAIVLRHGAVVLAHVPVAGAESAQLLVRPKP